MSSHDRFFFPDHLVPLEAKALSGGRASHSFRTHEDGRIPLSLDWERLFHALQRFNRVAVQSRHAYARMVVTQVPPVFPHLRSDLPAISADGTLGFNPAPGVRAWGRVEECPCCGSPGRVEFTNSRGEEFLQICSVPQTEAQTWGDAVMEMLPPLGECGAGGSLHASSGAPLVTPSAERLPADQEILCRLLADMGKHEITLLVTLQTVEACHVHPLCPRNVTVDDGVLTLSENSTWVQLALCGMQAFAVETARSEWPLSVIGPANTCLLRMVVQGENRNAWKNALRSAFSALAERRE